MMTKIHGPWIKLKEYLDREDYDLISKLQNLCIEKDEIALKLELDYKLGAFLSARTVNIGQTNEFMFFNGADLIGYIGVCQFGGDGVFEVNGMVHPDCRRQGVFTALYELVKAEWERRSGKLMYLLCDRKSEAGLAFIKKSGADYKHTEFEMFLRQEPDPSKKENWKGIVFRKARNSDAMEIARQDHIYFMDKLPEGNALEKDSPRKGLLLPEEEEKKGISIYFLEVDGKVAGKAHLQLISGIGGIYGLGVLPEYRGRGYGRALLLKAVEKLKEQKADEIMLQVEALNQKALRLYQSCGFKETSTMDYYGL